MLGRMARRTCRQDLTEHVLRREVLGFGEFRVFEALQPRLATRNEAIIGNLIRIS